MSIASKLNVVVVVLLNTILLLFTLRYLYKINMIYLMHLVFVNNNYNCDIECLLKFACMYGIYFKFYKLCVNLSHNYSQFITFNIVFP